MSTALVREMHDRTRRHVRHLLWAAPIIAGTLIGRVWAWAEHHHDKHYPHWDGER